MVVDYQANHMRVHRAGFTKQIASFARSRAYQTATQGHPQSGTNSVNQLKML